jgi:hypothetical protein
MGLRKRAVARVACVLYAAALLLSPVGASAELSDSEKAQIKGYLLQGRLPTAERVRALLVRPDLSLEDATRALTESIAPVSFQESTGAYLREVVFGGVSPSGRDVLVSAITRALLARADAIYAANPAHRDPHPEAMGELARIYTFLDAELADPGGPGGGSARGAILRSTYDGCVHALADHVKRNAEWLLPAAPVSPAFQRVRAQEEVTLYDMSNDSPTRRVDAAAGLGLAGTRQKLLTERGVLVVDAGIADEARLRRVRELLLRLPPGLVRPGSSRESGPLPPRPSDIEVIDFGDPRPPIHARERIVGVTVPLEWDPSKTGIAAPSEEVEPAPVDLPLFVLAYELSKVAASMVLAERPDLLRLAQGDVQAREAPAGGMTTEERVAGMMAQLLMDAPRTVDLAFSRFLNGRTRTAGLLSDALGVLAALSHGGPSASPPRAGRTVTLGRPRTPASESETEPLEASHVQLAQTGAVASFFLAHRWDVQRDPGGSVVGVLCDGKPVTLSALRSARALTVPRAP